MKKFSITEMYNEKTVITYTDSFDEAIQTYQDQMDGSSSPADRIIVCMKYNDKL